MESKHLRDCSSDGEAPILPMSPEDPEDPKPICDSPENEHKVPTWKSCNNAWCYLILGYLAGILMGLIWYYSNPKKGCRNLNGFWLLAVLFVPIAIILVYKPTARCIAALCIPTMASFQFRVLIIAFALLSAFSGPVENITRNIGILASSLTCDWNLLWKALDQMHLIMAQPSHSVEESFQGTMSELHRIIDKLNIHLVHLEIPFDQIHATYRTTLEWMQLQQDYFHHEMGSPYTRCMGAGLVSIHQCQSKLNNPRVSCPNQKYFACFCEDLQDLGSFFANNLQIQQMIMEDILRRLQLNFAKIRLTFIVTIIFDHNSEKDFYCSTPDKDLEEEINRSWDSYMQKFHFLYFWLYVIIFIILFQVVVRSMEFRFRYLASEDFDNVYITEDFEDYEEQHYQIQGIRALPLSNGEENKYVKISSMRLLPEEFELMKHSGMFLIITGIQLFCICYVDQFLYSFLNLMNYHGQRITTLNRSKKLKVEGSGQIADVLRDLLSAFEPKYSGVDPQACLPVPEKTRNYYYMLILLLYILAWFLVFWEPYGLRQRHRIMAYFYPDEADRRAHHLHFTILHERSKLYKRIINVRLINN
ncbi:hypothetical protein KR009_009924 [Drosophila setifemur]|nr:hypothetical protein KR009_009924 [Drosophila setifemur]